MTTKSYLLAGKVFPGIKNQEEEKQEIEEKNNKEVQKKYFFRIRGNDLFTSVTPYNPDCNNTAEKNKNTLQFSETQKSLLSIRRLAMEKHKATMQIDHISIKK